MTIAPPVPAEAEVMHRRMSAGRNKPLLLGCRAASGELVDCVVKLSACLESVAPLPYLAEWCAAAFGQLLGISVPEAFQVEVTDAFARSLDPPWRDIALRSLGVAFGSRHRAGGFSPWPARTLIPFDLREAAVELVAFDVLIHNPDRRIDNPNVLVSRDEILAFDHEMAFSFVLPLLGAPDPVEDALLPVLDQHLFARDLAEKCRRWLASVRPSSRSRQRISTRLSKRRRLRGNVALRSISLLKSSM